MSRNRRSPLVRLLRILALLLVIALIALGIWYLVAGRLKEPEPTPPSPTTPPAAQPADCPDVQVVSVPGTWESSRDDDPYTPHANPQALLLNVTTPLSQQYPDTRADIYTVPYVAQFSNPVAIPPDGQASYNVSRSEGTDRAVSFMRDRAAHCPLTSYVVIGFSQGAVIGGDIAEMIGNGKGPVAADKVLGVALIADGRREHGQGVPLGANPPGVGGEVSLAGVDVPGITMTGRRDDGFGALNDRTYTVCAPSDGICDAPEQAFAPGNWLAALSRLPEYVGNPIHAQYNTFVVDQNGTTASQWMLSWIRGLIADAPETPRT